MVEMYLFFLSVCFRVDTCFKPKTDSPLFNMSAQLTECLETPWHVIWQSQYIFPKRSPACSRFELYVTVFNSDEMQY